MRGWLIAGVTEVVVSAALFSGCAAYKHINVTSDPAGMNIVKGGIDVGVTPLELRVRAGDLFCTSGYWDFFLEAYDFAGQYSPQRRHIDPCIIANGSLVSFTMLDSDASGMRRRSEARSLDEETVIQASSGSAWAVGGGIAVTAAHVVEGRSHLTLIRADGQRVNAAVMTIDHLNDIAVLAFPVDFLETSLHLLTESAALGETVFTIGFPLPDIMGFSPKYTSGEISSLTGFRDDPRLYQISVPVQSGNSGGPLLNSKGEVIGMVISKLNAAALLHWTGDLPQNVNYAIKSAYIRPLMALNDAETSADMVGAETGDLSEIIEKVSAAILYVLAE